MILRLLIIIKGLFLYGFTQPTFASLRIADLAAFNTSVFVTNNQQLLFNPPVLSPIFQFRGLGGNPNYYSTIFVIKKKFDSGLTVFSNLLLVKLVWSKIPDTTKLNIVFTSIKNSVSKYWPVIASGRAVVSTSYISIPIIGIKINSHDMPLYQKIYKGHMRDDFENIAFVIDLNRIQIIFPLKLVSFSAQLINGNVRLSWIVASPINVARYEIECSTNGTIFTNVGYKNATASVKYKFIHTTPASKNVIYYRLKIKNKNGTHSYSSVQKINRNVPDFEVKPYFIK